MSSLDGKLATTGTDGEVANALVCKTSIHGFKSHSVLHNTLKAVAHACLDAAAVIGGISAAEERRAEYAAYAGDVEMVQHV